MGREKEGGVKRAIIISHYYLYIYNLFRVSLFHSDETFHVYACTRSVFFSNKIYKKPVTFF